ncbi:MAG: hypothetical protein Tsb0020_24320 [Haliangiales bacterium]
MAHYDDPRHSARSHGSVQKKQAPGNQFMQTHSESLPARRSAPTPIVQRRADGSPVAPLPFAGLPAEQAEAAFRPHVTPVQARGELDPVQKSVHESAAEGVSGSGSSLPHLDRIQQAFGPSHDVSQVKAHVGGAAAQASEAIGAEAYATGNNIAFRSTPDLHTAAHEAAHVVQQRQGVSLEGGVGQAGDSYEKHADAVADRVVAGESAADLLGGGASAGASAAVQNKPAKEANLQLDVGTGQAPAASGQQQAAVRNLGEITTFGDSFYSRAGAVLDALLPNEGDKGKVQINVNLPVNANVRVSFQFVCEGERNSNGIKSRVEVGAGVTATVDLWVAEAFAQAMVFGYLEAQGSNGAEVFRFMSLALYERVASVSRDAADYVWGRSFRRRSRAMMEGEDFVESGMGVEFSAGLSADGGNQAVGAGVRASTGTRIDPTGEHSVAMLAGKFAITSAPWSGEVGVQLSGNDGQEAGQLSFSLARNTNILDFATMLEDGSIQTIMLDWCASSMAMLQSLIRQTNGAQGQNLARRVGAIANMVRSGSLGVSLGSAAAIRGLSGTLSSLSAASMGQKLTIALGVTPSSISFQADLERTSQLEFGANARAPVYVSLETASSMLSLGPATANV